MRPKKFRKINFSPNVTYFKPRGIPMRMLKQVELEYDEVEALRLKNVEGLDQTSSAAKMGISQCTFQRILDSANKKISTALIDGQAIKINLEREADEKS